MDPLYGLKSHDIRVRYAMEYEYRRGTNPTMAASNINDAYPEAVSVRTCQQWWKRWKEEGVVVEDKERSGRPSKIDNEMLTDLIEMNPKFSGEEIGEILEVDSSTVTRHLAAIGKRYVSSVWVPHDLTPQQKANRVKTCQELLSRQNTEGFIKWMVTGDEKLIYYNNASKKGEWRSTDQRPIGTPRPDFRQQKVMLSVWWDKTGIIHWELLEIGATISADLYCQQLTRLRDKLIEKRYSMVNKWGVNFQQDNAPSHTAKTTKNLLKQFGWKIVDHPPYSPDIAPSDYYLFRSMRHFLDGKKFKNREEVEMAVSDYFAKQPEEWFAKGIQDLPNRWREVIDLNGDYILR
ncbi:histone-lysine N-methyltransferase SETMAR-like [Oppia nitens]|uniref:histone-lysine N-methyltransferase SETMAR-like n=1 Tax=Oppia nitens TaxID=1686743 RepID=UPI0023DCE39E|nr:histone-lysine N-methyltransferase SETMAR-like [Oppia nitens]